MPSSAPASTGLGKPRGRAKGRRGKPKQTKASQMKKIALSLKDTKKHSSSVSNFTLWKTDAAGAGRQPFVVIKPLTALAMSATNSETARESNMVYAMNTRLDLNITTNPLTLNPYHLRIIKGWAKGNASYGTAPSAQMPNDQLSEANISLTIPNHFTEIDSDDFKVLMDKTYTLAPRQVYDAYPGSEHATDNRALWKDFTFKHNWKFDRKYKFEDSTGASLVGWHPFIAIQIDRSVYGPQFTGTSGACPSPTVQYNFDTYFKDIN